MKVPPARAPPPDQRALERHLPQLTYPYPEHLFSRDGMQKRMNDRMPPAKIRMGVTFQGPSTRPRQRSTARVPSPLHEGRPRPQKGRSRRFGERNPPRALPRVSLSAPVLPSMSASPRLSVAARTALAGGARIAEKGRHVSLAQMAKRSCIGGEFSSLHYDAFGQNDGLWTAMQRTQFRRGVLMDDASKRSDAQQETRVASLPLEVFDSLELARLDRSADAWLLSGSLAWAPFFDALGEDAAVVGLRGTREFSLPALQAAGPLTVPPVGAPRRWRWRRCRVLGVAPAAADDASAPQLPCFAVEFLEERSAATGELLARELRKPRVSRLNLRFEQEDEALWNQRIASAEALRQKAMDHQNYDVLVRNVPTALVGALLTTAQPLVATTSAAVVPKGGPELQRIHRLVLDGLPSGFSVPEEGSSAWRQLEQLTREVVENHTRLSQRACLESRLKRDAVFRKHYLCRSFPEPERLDRTLVARCSTNGLVDVAHRGDYTRAMYVSRRSQISKKCIVAVPTFASAIARLNGAWTEKFAGRAFCDTQVRKPKRLQDAWVLTSRYRQVPELALPCDCRILRDAQMQVIDSSRGELNVEWRQVFVQNLIDSIQEEFDIFLKDEDAFRGSNMERLLQYVDTSMRTMLFDMLRRSFDAFLAFLDEATAVGDECAPYALFHMRIRAKGGSIVTEPTFDEVTTSLKHVLERIIKSASGLLCVEQDVMIMLNCRRRPLLDLLHREQDGGSVLRDKVLERFAHAEKEVVRMVEVRSGELVEGLLARYEAFAFVFTEFPDLEALSRRLQASLDFDASYIERFLKTIVRYDRAAKDIRDASIDSVRIGCFLIDAQTIKKAIRHRATAVRDAFSTFVLERSLEVVERIHQDARGLRETLQALPDNESQLRHRMKTIESISPAIERMMESVTEIHANVHNLEMLRMQHHLSAKVIGSLLRAKRIPFEIEALVEKTNAEIVFRKRQMQEDLLNEITEFEAMVEGIPKRIDAVTALSDFGDFERNFDLVTRLQRAIQDARVQNEDFKVRGEVFGMLPSESAELESLAKEIEPYVKLWNLIYDYRTSAAEWTTIKVLAQLEAESMGVLLERWGSDADALLLLFTSTLRNPSATQCVRELIGSIREFLAHLPVVECLCSDALQPRHWERISQLVSDLWSDGEDHVLDPHETTLGTLLDLGVDRLILALEDIHQIATKEHELDVALSSMIRKWATLSLELGERSGTFILVTADEIADTLDDHLAKTAIMRSSPHIHAIEFACLEWQLQLRGAVNILDMWLKVQRDWMRLEPIFQFNDIKEQLPREARSFKWVDNFFRSIMGTAAKEQLFMSVAKHPGLLKNLKTCGEHLDRIQKNLDAYLEQKRARFPRFYFISDDQLIDILCQHKEPRHMQVHFQKIFEGTKSVSFSDLEGAPSITALLAPQGEAITLAHAVRCSGDVEHWLSNLESCIFRTVREEVATALRRLSAGSSRLEWIAEHPAQVVLAVGMVGWTHEVSGAIQAQELPSMLDLAHARLNMYASTLSTFRRASSSKIKLEAVTTLGVHCRDVLERLIEQDITSCGDFSWKCQLRYYWEPHYSRSKRMPGGTETVQQLLLRTTDTTLSYSYEYLGNTTRLVMTPLTERCYHTMINAIENLYGGAPEGPAGTGKTETIKDLARAVAVNCTVLNAAEGLDHRATAKFLKGLVTSGSWSCIDEFNRMHIEVLSVVSSQITALTTAKQARHSKTEFEGTTIPLELGFNIFVTMNPDYVGRSELPDNLKALLRPCAMMVADFAKIAEVRLYTYGFLKPRELARKFVRIHRLCSEQLSKQSHYDYGMRALNAVIAACGERKLHARDADEDEMAVSALKDVNEPKLLPGDDESFAAILADTFPNSRSYSDISNNFSELAEAACEALAADAATRLIVSPNFLQKLRFLRTTLDLRHGIMLIGSVASGKSSTLQIVARVMTLEDSGAPVAVQHIFPKAMSVDELYGVFDKQTHAWHDGVLGGIFRECAQDKSNVRHWIHLDGPVDSLWIESMNSVLDDNRKLCLVSSEVIRMTQGMRIVYEALSLRSASPATVSRVGVVFFDRSTITWRETFAGFLAAWKPEHEALRSLNDALEELAAWLIPPLLDFLASGTDDDVHSQLPSSALVEILLRCFSSMLPAREDACHSDGRRVLEGIFVEALCWGLGGMLGSHARTAFSEYLRALLAGKEEGLDGCPAFAAFRAGYGSQRPGPREVHRSAYWDAHFAGGEQAPRRAMRTSLWPTSEGESSCFGYTFSAKSLQWRPWDSYRARTAVPERSLLHTLFVPTASTESLSWFLDVCDGAGTPILCFGPMGSGKTTMIQRHIASRTKEGAIGPKGGRGWGQGLPRSGAESFASDSGALLSPGSHVSRASRASRGSDLSVTSGRSVGTSSGGNASSAAVVSLTAYTSTQDIRDSLASKLTRRRRGVYGPRPSQRGIVFVDDLSAARPDAYGDKAPVEFLRQLFADGGWHVASSQQNFCRVIDTSYIVAATRIDGARIGLCPRFLRRAQLINCSTYSVADLCTIFGKMAEMFTRECPASIRSYSPLIVKASVDLLVKLQARFPPTPKAVQHHFSIKCLVRVFQGIFCNAPAGLKATRDLLRPWAHECDRVFYDRLLPHSRTQYASAMEGVRSHAFPVDWENIVAPGERLAFGHVPVPQSIPDHALICEAKGKKDEASPPPAAAKGAAPHPPRAHADHVSLRLDRPVSPALSENSVRPLDCAYEYKEQVDFARMTDELSLCLQERNERARRQSLPTIDIVLFEEAALQVLRIARIISMQGGHAILTGHPGSGRRSLLHLATFVSQFKVFSFQAERLWEAEWREALRNLLTRAGAHGERIVLTLDESQVKDDSMLDDVAAFLGTGGIPGLFMDDESKAVVLRHMLQAVSRGDETSNEWSEEPAKLMELFAERCRQRLHVVLTFSQDNLNFRRWLREFPALLSCTTMIWFTPWAEDALCKVADNTFRHHSFLSAEEADCLCRAAAKLKSPLGETSPAIYLLFVRHTSMMLRQEQRLHAGQLRRYERGLVSFRETQSTVNELQVELEELQPLLLEKSAEAATLLETVRREEELARTDTSSAEVKSKRARELEQSAALLESECKAELEAAYPVYEEAIASLNRLDASDITEIKRMQQPPHAVKYVLASVCVLLRIKPQRSGAPGERSRSRAARRTARPGTALSSTGSTPATPEGREAREDLDLDGYFAAAQRNLLTKANFIQRLISFDTDSISPRLLQEISLFTSDERFDVTSVGRASKAAAGLWKWVHAVEKYARVASMVRPKQKRLHDAIAERTEAQSNADAMRQILESAAAKLRAIQDKFATAETERKALEERSEQCRQRLDRASQLLEGLKLERDRWLVSMEKLRENAQLRLGDSLLGAAALTYHGALPERKRRASLEDWKAALQRLDIAVRADFSAQRAFASPMEVEDWVLKGLPNDGFSKDNAALMDQSLCYPLLVDPQGQATRWLRNRFPNMKVSKPSKSAFRNTVENAFQFGARLLVENVNKDVPPSLLNILRIGRVPPGGRPPRMRIGDQVVAMAEEFSLYMTALSRPRLEAAGLGACINVIVFSTTRSSIEDSMLSLVVATEHPDLEKTRRKLLEERTSGQKRLKQLEDLILMRMEVSGGDVLDDVDLVEALDAATKTASQLTARNAALEAQAQANRTARDHYGPVARRAALLFFSVANLERLDRMYSFSLDWFIALFRKAIAAAPVAPKERRFHQRFVSKDARILAIIEVLTEHVYDAAASALFQSHQPLFSLQLALNVAESCGWVGQPALRFLAFGAEGFRAAVAGGVEPGHEALSQLNRKAYADLAALSDIPGRGTSGLIEQHILPNLDSWRAFLSCANPIDELNRLTSSAEFNPVDRLLIMRCLRADALESAAQETAALTLGNRYTEPATADLRKVLREGGCATPILFLLKPRDGCDPLPKLRSLASDVGLPSSQLRALSMGDSQRAKAEAALRSGLDIGGWVYLQNLHLVPSWLPTLSVLCEDMHEDVVHEKFRLWLSCEPISDFPGYLLRKCRKVSEEAPRGIRSSLLTAFSEAALKPDELGRMRAKQEAEWSSDAAEWAASHGVAPEHRGPLRKALFALCFLHAQIKDRHRFGALGWNSTYVFSENDLSISKKQLVSAFAGLSEGDTDVDWKRLRYLIGACNYGGRLTEEQDRLRLQLLVDNAISPEIAFGTSERFLAEGYLVPRDPGDRYGWSPYRKYIQRLPHVAPPEAFGLHENARMDGAMEFCATLRADVAAQLQIASQTSTIPSGRAMLRSASLLLGEDSFMTQLSSVAARLPRLLDEDLARHKLKPTFEESMNTVLLNEVRRYNELLRAVLDDVANLRLAGVGEEMLSRRLNDMTKSIQCGDLPGEWRSISYPSDLRLNEWISDLGERFRKLRDWIDDGTTPRSFWLGGFFFPHAFIGAIFQNHARRLDTPLDQLEMTAAVLCDGAELAGATEGTIITGLHLHGASWNAEGNCIDESRPQELYARVPPVHFLPQPREGDAPRGEASAAGRPTAAAEHAFECPLYRTPRRAGTIDSNGHSSSYIMSLGLPMRREHSQRHWILRGAALTATTA